MLLSSAPGGSRHRAEFSSTVESQTRSRDYQLLSPNVIMRELLSKETNGSSSYTPFGVETQTEHAPASKGIRVALAALAVLAIGLALCLNLGGWSLGNKSVLAVLAVAAAVAERGRVRLDNRLETSITLIPVLLAAVLFGPLAAMVVAFVSWIDHLHRPYMKWAIYSCTNAITAAMARVGGGASTTPFVWWPRLLRHRHLVCCLGCGVGRSGFNCGDLPTSWNRSSSRGASCDASSTYGRGTVRPNCCGACVRVSRCLGVDLCCSS